MLSRLGDAQLSGATLAGQFLGLYQLCVLGIAIGASVLTGRFWGSGDLPRLKHTVTVMLWTMTVFAAGFTVITALFPEGILRLYSRDVSVTMYGAAYLRCQLPAYLCMGLSVGCTVVLRSVGQVRVPLYASVGALAVNLAAGWLLIFGEPDMGVAGASVALLLARVFEFAVICGYFFFKDRQIAYRLWNLTAGFGGMLRPYLRMAVPIFVSNALLGLGENVAAAVLGHMGQTYVAASSAASVMQLMSGVLTQGIAHAAGIITGHTIGRGDGESAQKQGEQMARLSFGIGAATALLILLLRKPVIGLYGISAEAADIAHSLTGALALITLFQTPGTLLSKGVLRAGGDAMFLMVVDAVLQWAAAIPLGALAGLVWDAPVFIVYVLLRIDQVLRWCICEVRLHQGKWLKTIEGNA